MRQIDKKLLTAGLALTMIACSLNTAIAAAPSSSTPCPLKGSVENVDTPVDETGDDLALHKYVDLWFVAKWSPQGTSLDVAPVLYQPTGMQKNDLDRLLKKMNDSEAIAKDTLAWQKWYQQILGVVPHAMHNIPPEQHHRFNIKVFVSADKRIFAWVEDESSPGLRHNSFPPEIMEQKQRFDYAHRLVNALNALDGKPLLKFPAHSKALQVEFKMSETYPEQGVALDAIRNTIY